MEGGGKLTSNSKGTTSHIIYNASLYKHQKRHISFIPQLVKPPVNNGFYLIDIISSELEH